MPTRSVLFFCGTALVGQPISQRVGAFAAYLAGQGWDVRLTTVDPAFDGAPHLRPDPLSGLEVEIVGPPHYALGPGGDRVVRSPASYGRECRAIAGRLRARAAAMDADRIVISTTLPASLYAIGALRRSARSLWVDVDDWSAGQFRAAGGTRLQAAGYQALEAMVPRLAHGITVCSDELAALYPGASLVPNFIRLDEVPARRPATPGSDVRVAFVSSMTAYHGHRPFLEALARRRAACTGLDVRLIGDGVALDECRRFVDRAGLGDTVRFTGRVSRPAMLEELVQADVSVLALHDTRLDRARFPLKMLDALACGCALAASATGMVRETLRHGETARLSPPGDMDALLDDVLALAADPEQRARLSANGRTLVRDYDEEAVCRRWMALLSSGSTGGRRGRRAGPTSAPAARRPVT